MWLFGVIVLMSLIAGTIVLANRKPRSTSSRPRWDIETLTGSASAIVAPLASFSVAAAVFLANLTRVSQTPFFADVMALFLIAFLILMGSAIMYATERSIRVDQQLNEAFDFTYRGFFILATTTFFLGITTSWIGLHPLLLSIDLIQLADIFSWLLLFAILAGGIRMVAWLYSLLEIRFVTGVTIPIFSLTGATLYRLVLVPRFPFLWPQDNPVLSFSVLVFALAGMAIAVETIVIAFHGDQRLYDHFRGIGRTVLPPYIALTLVAVFLLWLSTVIQTP